MKQIDLLEELKQLGVSVCDRTLRNWVSKKIIPAPDLISRGYRRGNICVYPAWTASYAYAARRLRKAFGLTTKQLAKLHAEIVREEEHIFKGRKSKFKFTQMHLLYGALCLMAGDHIPVDIPLCLVNDGEEGGCIWVPTSAEGTNATYVEIHANPSDGLKFTGKCVEAQAQA
jgi:hypothetical protein